jgi:hypothetical protein
VLPGSTRCCGAAAFVIISYFLCLKNGAQPEPRAAAVS